MSAKKEVQSTQSRTRSPNWSGNLDGILLRVMKEQQVLGNCIAGQVKKEVWPDIVLSFNRRSGASLEKTHLKNRLKVLKRIYALYHTLASRNGWSWDYARNLPIPQSAPDLEAAIAENPKYAKCREKPFAAYKDLEVILGNNMIIDMHDATLMLDDDGSGDDTSPARDTNAPQLTAENLNNGEPLSSSDVAIAPLVKTTDPDVPLVTPLQPPVSSKPYPSNPQTPLNGHPVEDQSTRPKKRKRNNPSATCTCHDHNSNAKVLAEFIEIGRQCLEIAREMLHREPVARPKVFSLEECVEKLNGLNDVSPDALLALLDAFKDRDNRIVFISLDGPLLSAWIDRQVTLQSESRSAAGKG